MFEFNKKYKEDYVAFMKSMIEKAFAEKVPPTKCLLKADLERGQPNPRGASEGQEGSCTTDRKI